MSHQRKIYPVMLISTPSCTECQHVQPKAFLRRVWASISNGDFCILRLQMRAAWGFGRRKGTSCTATTSVLLFGNLAACLCSTFFIPASHAPWRVLLLSPVFIKVSLQLLETWWDAGASDIGGDWMCVYLLPGTIKRDVWRRVATEWPCLWPKAPEWRRKHPASLPPTLSISWQRKATHWVRWCQTCQDRPSCTPFIPSLSVLPLFTSTFSLPLSLSVWRRIA